MDIIVIVALIFYGYHLENVISKIKNKLTEQRDYWLDMYFQEVKKYKDLEIEYNKIKGDD